MLQTKLIYTIHELLSLINTLSIYIVRLTKFYTVFTKYLVVSSILTALIGKFCVPIVWRYLNKNRLHASNVFSANKWSRAPQTLGIALLPYFRRVFNQACMHNGENFVVRSSRDRGNCEYRSNFSEAVLQRSNHWNIS